MNKHVQHPREIILYDGECPFCNRMVLLLLRLDKQERLRFAALESETAKNALGPYSEKLLAEDTIVMITENGFFTKSKAVAQALQSMKYSVLAHLILIVPSLFRDGMYDLIARNRKRLYQTCPPIPPTKRHLFLP